MLCMNRMHCSPVLSVSTNMYISSSSGNMLWPDFIHKEFVIHGKTEENRYFDCRIEALSL